MGKKKHKRPESESEALDRGDSEAQLVNGCSPEKKKRRKKKKLENEEIEGEKREPVSKPTVSIAVSGSIIDNAQSLELATRVRIFFFYRRVFFRVPATQRMIFCYAFSLRYLICSLAMSQLSYVIFPFSLCFMIFFSQLAGQIARAATIFRIDEVSVFLSLFFTF